MKPMLKAKFYELVNSLLARGIKPELKWGYVFSRGNLIWKEVDGSTQVEPLYTQGTTTTLRNRFDAWFADIMAAHEASQQVTAPESKKFTAIVNAADAEGIAQDYAVHFEASSAEAMPAAVKAEWENLYGDDSWNDRGAEITGFTVGWVQIYEVAMSQDDDGSDAARQVFEAATSATVAPAFTLKIGRRHTAEYQTAAAARDAYKRLRDESMEGGSTWPDGIITSGKTKIYLSYNGRTWADRQHTQSIEL